MTIGTVSSSQIHDIRPANTVVSEIAVPAPYDQPEIFGETARILTGPRGGEASMSKAHDGNAICLFTVHTKENHVV